MKKYIVFIASFILLYVAYQITSGVILTMNYIPDFSTTGSFTAQNFSFRDRSYHLLVLLLIASIAYGFSQLLKTKKS
ncbi:hypothetical protein [Halobacillus halophilus]|uniref:hypothetical protein n=1 Tax=Halobacillus halophilus TaxID=1570 RepID=UPI001CD75E7F|nr:hypothetical protein [Halobacillus halophilus]MCA1011474.1 hypothetical protein [Halobacillus halophilus]